MSATPDDLMAYEVPEMNSHIEEGDARWKRLEKALGHPIKRFSMEKMLAAVPDDWGPHEPSADDFLKTLRESED